MKLFPTPQTRDEYIETQIERSERKFRYCKVSIHDAKKYRDLITGGGGATSGLPGPVLCLGTRNGREVDIFRTQWFSAPWLAALTRLVEDDSMSFRSRIPILESFGRSRVGALTATSVIGVELNPRAARQDVWIGSFDDMPAHWAGRFGVVYSNAFDQSQNPEATAAEWKRVLRPGGYLIFCYTKDVEPTVSDRVGGLSLPDVLQLFGGRTVSSSDRGSRNGYSEVVLQL